MIRRKKKKKQPQGSPLLAVFMTLGFVWLAHGSLHHCAARRSLFRGRDRV